MIRSRWVLGAGAGLLLAMTVAGLHGYSISAWHALIDGSREREVLRGHSRGLRGDDFVVTIPMALAQRADRPRFPVRSSLIGDGRCDMVINYPMPVRHVTTLFRPQVWGFFVGPDAGLAFQWWFQAIGLWLVAYFVMLELLTGPTAGIPEAAKDCRPPNGIAPSIGGSQSFATVGFGSSAHVEPVSRQAGSLVPALGATALLYSPFVQAWALNCAPSVIYPLGVVLAAVRQRRATTAIRRVAWCAAAGWFVGAWLLTFSFMPYLLSMGYLALALAVGFAWEKGWRESDPAPSVVHSSSFSGRGRPPSNERNDSMDKPLHHQLDGDLVNTLERGTQNVISHGTPGETRECQEPGSVPTRTLADGSVAATFGTWRTWGWLLAFAVAAIAVVGMLWGHMDTIRTIAHSAYPGHRRDNGGTMYWSDIFRGYYTVFMSPSNMTRFGNTCEMAAFMLFFPVAMVRIARRWRVDGVAPRPIEWALLLTIGFLLTWCLAGFPRRLAVLSLMDRAAPGRMTLALGVADLLLVVASLWRPRGVAETRWSRSWLALACGAWCLFILLMMRPVHRPFPDTPMTALWPGAAAAAAIGMGLLVWPRASFGVLALVSILSTAGVNPVVRGGTKFLYRNDLSRAMVAVDRAQQERGLNPRWVVCGPTLYPMSVANLPRILGLHAINGVLPYPQGALWHALDPTGARINVWNRYAHVAFDVSGGAGPPVIRLAQRDVVAVEVHPGTPEFRALELTALLYVGMDVDRVRGMPGMRWVASFGDKNVFEIGP